MQVCLATHRPQRLSVHPGGGAVTPDVPHGENISEAVEAVQQVVEALQPAREIAMLDARLDAGKEVVDSLEVRVLR